MSAGPPDRPPESIRRQVRRPGKAGPVAVIEGFAGRRSVVPFAILVLCLLAVGLVLLLLLNTALDRGAFEIQTAQKKQSQLTDRQQELQLRLAGLSAPGALASQAAGLGLVPNPRPVFLDPGNGAVLGIPTSAPTTAPPAPSASPSPSASQSSSPAATATVSASPGVSGRAMPPANGPGVPVTPDASPSSPDGASPSPHPSTTPTASASATGSRP